MKNMQNFVRILYVLRAPVEANLRLRLRSRIADLGSHIWDMRAFAAQRSEI